MGVRAGKGISVAAAGLAALAALPASAGPATAERAQSAGDVPKQRFRLLPGHPRLIVVRSRRPAGRLEVRAVAVGCDRGGRLSVRPPRGVRLAFDVSVPRRWTRVLMPLPEGSHRLRLRFIAPRGGPRCRAILRGRPRLLGRSVKLGAAARSDRLSDPRYVSTLVRNFDSLTPENEMKMFAFQPRPGQFDFKHADALVRLARRNRMAVRGHTLVYGLQLPEWVSDPRKPWTRGALLRVMRRHITKVVKHYRGRVSQWDVVNEPIDGDGRFIRNVWYRAIGPGYVEHAFRAARRADPGAALFLNENSAETTGNPKARAVYRLVKRLKRRGVPVDGVGLQNHTDTVLYPRRRPLAAAMGRFARLGLRVEVTEMDVVTNPRLGRAAQLREQALAFTAAEQACRAVAACSRITTWGFTDNTTWKGPRDLPLLFDKRYREKPSFRALARGVALPSAAQRLRRDSRRAIRLIRDGAG